jgi:hypothetical protein
LVSANWDGFSCGWRCACGPTATARAPHYPDDRRWPGVARDRADGVGLGASRELLQLAGVGDGACGQWPGLISVPQSALLVQEAPTRSLGTVTAFRTTTGQLALALGFALGFASSGAMVNGFGFASLRDRMLQLGSTPVQSHQLESLLREALSGGGLSQHSGAASNAIQVMSEAYASGLAGTMVGVALIVGLLGAISLLLLVIGHRQQRTEESALA